MSPLTRDQVRAILDDASRQAQLDRQQQRLRRRACRRTSPRLSATAKRSFVGPGDAGIDVETDVCTDLSIESALEALTQLPKHGQRLIRWRFGLGGPEFSIDQIAARLRVPPVMARALVESALQTLRAMLVPGEPMPRGVLVRPADEASDAAAFVEREPRVSVAQLQQRLAAAAGHRSDLPQVQAQMARARPEQRGRRAGAPDQQRRLWPKVDAKAEPRGRVK